MKRSLFLILTTVVLLVSCSKDRIAASGSVVTEDRDETDFTGISTSGSNNVHVSKAAAYSVKLKGSANLFAYYETRAVNGILKLGYKKDVNIKNDNIEVFVTLPSLELLSVAGSGNIYVEGSFDGNNTFETTISGSGNIDLDQGTAQNFSCTISGSGNVRAFGMLAEKAVITLSGSGNAEIAASSFLTVNILGSGDVYYKGSPAITSNISGSGSVIAK